MALVKRLWIKEEMKMAVAKYVALTEQATCKLFGIKQPFGEQYGLKPIY